MCRFTLSSRHFCGILDCANKIWFRDNGTKQYGATHVERTPKDWASHFLSAKTSFYFSNHILSCIKTNRQTLLSAPIPQCLKQDFHYTQNAQKALDTNSANARNIDTSPSSDTSQIDIPICGIVVVVSSK
eukprot:15327429-Ditylum_brightwellii.AAC.1